MVQLSKNEALALADFLEANLIKYIRNESHIDFGFIWLQNMVSIWNKCKSGGRDDG